MIRSLLVSFLLAMISSSEASILHLTREDAGQNPHAGRSNPDSRIFAASSLPMLKGFRLGRRTSGKPCGAYIWYVSRANPEVQRPQFLKGEEYAKPGGEVLLLIKKIALEESIPFKLLQGITYVESGFHPWILNVQGKPYVFSTRQEAEAFLEEKIRKGMTNIDIGCSQVNWQFHGKHFTHPVALLSPETSLRYAARLLHHHHLKTRSWMKAALLYHSTDKIRQSVYRKRLVQYLTKRQRA